MTDSTGTVVGEQRYYPYGETRFTSGTLNTDKQFTGQRDVGLGIYHYGARFYSPKLGRFLSADTIIPGAGNPQAYNRYSYVLGNPLKYIDPTGHYCVGDDEDCADEGGYGPAPSGSGGGNNGGGGGGGGGNPHDDDAFDPNPNGFTAPDVILPSPEEVAEDPWVYSYTEVEGIHLGPVGQVHFPDYNDDGYNGMPWVSGPYDYSDNFFIAFTVSFNESSGVHMSDIHWSNQYNGLVILDSAKINDRVIRIDSSYIPADGIWYPIQGTGGDYDSETSISVNVNLGWIGNAGNGPFPILVTIPVNVPSLNQVISILQP